MTKQTKPKPTPPDAAAEQRRDVDALAGLDQVDVTIDGLQFVVRPMRVRQLFPFLKLARPLFAALAQKAASPPAAGLPPTPGDSPGPQGGESIAGQDALLAMVGDVDWMLSLVEESGPQLVAALAAGIDKSPEDLGELSVVGIVVLLKHFVVLNAGFFTAQGLTLPQTLPAGFRGLGAAGGVASQA
jgi:hypothetical protein